MPEFRRLGTRSSSGPARGRAWRRRHRATAEVPAAEPPPAGAGSCRTLGNRPPTGSRRRSEQLLPSEGVPEGPKRERRSVRIPGIPRGCPKGTSSQSPSRPYSRARSGCHDRCQCRAPPHLTGLSTCSGAVMARSTPASPTTSPSGSRLTHLGRPPDTPAAGSLSRLPTRNLRNQNPKPSSGRRPSRSSAEPRRSGWLLQSPSATEFKLL